MMFMLFLIMLKFVFYVDGACDNACSGHGICQDNGVCNCYEGFGLGLSLDSGDCSQRICPFEIAWVDSPDRIGDHHRYVECSAKGICNRDTGECDCFPGYDGKACSRTTCHNECSGHGQCVYLDEVPFKSVVGDFNNYNYIAKFFTAMGTTPSTAISISISTSAEFIAALKTNTRIVVGTTIYYVASIDTSTSSFKVAPTIGGAAMNSNSTSTSIAFKESSSYSLIALPTLDSKRLAVSGSNTGALVSKIPHGLSVGDIFYLSDITIGMSASLLKGLNNVLYGVATVTSSYEFDFTTLGLTSEGLTLASATITTSNINFLDINLNMLIPTGVLTIASGVAKISTVGQFDHVDPFIDSLSNYIERKYWDAKKTRACICDPEYGDVDCSARMCQHGTDVMDSQKDQSVSGKNQIQVVSFTCQTNYQTSFSPVNSALKGKTFALTFKTKLNESFSTIPINMPYLITTTTVTDAILNIRNFELDVEWALKTLPSSVIDGIKVRVTKPLDTTGVISVAGTYSNNTVRFAATNVLVDTGGIPGTVGATTNQKVFEFSVEFTGNNVQGTQHYLTVEAAKCGDGCFPKTDGLIVDSAIDSLTVVTQPTMSTGLDNDMESDFNSYECGRRGKCDYRTGLCSCFAGYTGNSCNIITALV